MNFDNKEINDNIEAVSKKYGYSKELNNVLKRIVPCMLKDKNDESKKMLFETLNRVKIFVLPYGATKEDIDKCQKEIYGDINKGIEFVSENRGEYGKGMAPGAYNTEPVFDENMNIIDRKSFLYVTELSNNSKLCKEYDTNINLSHLIHELGHAWASEKQEYIQDENGNYITNVGACTLKCSVDKENKKVESIGYENLLIEESLNTIEEENVLCELLNIDNIKELNEKGYVPSIYQGTQTDIMKSYIEKFGKESFDNFRFLKDKEALKEIEKALEDTPAWVKISTEEYEKNKKEKFKKVNELDVSDDAKQRINEFFDKYSDVYFPDNSKFTAMQKLENVFTQLYNFNSIKYNFNIIKNDNNMEIYKQVVIAMTQEGYVLKNQAKDIVRSNKEDIEKNTFLNGLKEKVVDDKDIVLNENKYKEVKKREIEDIGER